MLSRNWTLLSNRCQQSLDATRQCRGIGAGAAMMARCLDAARGFGFRRCYIETLEGMDAAMRLYERSGFHRIDQPMGATGHGGCNAFYLLELAAP